MPMLPEACECGFEVCTISKVGNQSRNGIRPLAPRILVFATAEGHDDLEDGEFQSVGQRTFDHENTLAESTEGIVPPLSTLGNRAKFRSDLRYLDGGPGDGCKVDNENMAVIKISNAFGLFVSVALCQVPPTLAQRSRRPTSPIFQTKRSGPRITEHRSRFRACFCPTCLPRFRGRPARHSTKLWRPTT